MWTNLIFLPLPSSATVSSYDVPITPFWAWAHNLTIRTFIRRYTRLSLGFSKKKANLSAAVALHLAYYNFCWKHGTLKTSPAVAAGLTDRVWKLWQLLECAGVLDRSEYI